jgi:HNH endonuclease
MSDIPAALADLVRLRARGRCEYCQLSQLGQEAAFHIDHIIPRAANGPTVETNLALACVSCSLRKGARRVAIDPATGNEEPLFHPREQAWGDHFRWEGERIVPLTATGRATVDALVLNRPIILGIRQEEAARGRHPPSA